MKGKKSMNVDCLCVTKEQLDVIVGIIINQAAMLAEMKNENKRKYSMLFDEDFIRGRGTYGGTGSILSGFREDTMIPGIKIKKVNYGLNDKLCQPELESDGAIIQIYSASASLNTKEIIKKCKEAKKSNKIFSVIQFFMSKKSVLKKIDFVCFDENAKEIYRKVLYQKSNKIVPFSA